MKLFQFAFIATLTGAALGASADEVACVLNGLRRDYGLGPLAISQKLMWSANQMATASRNYGQSMTTVPGNRELGDRYRRFGYQYSDGTAMGAYGYSNHRQFANFMIQMHHQEIINPRMRHLGYENPSGFGNLDLGDSFNSKEPIRYAVGC